MRPRGKLCGHPGCQHLAPCPDHGPAAKMAAYNARRRSAGPEFYSSPEWRRISRAFLATHRTCQCGPDCCPEGCGRRANVVDHVEQRPRGAPLDRSRWDADGNLQALAGRPCHLRKTMRETNEQRKAARS